MYCESDLVKTEAKLRRCPKRREFVLPALFALLLLLSAFGMRGEAASAQDYDMRITAIDIGGSGNYGDSVVLTTGGRTLLMDAGWEEKTSYVISWLKNNNRRKVDLYISHYHDDHMDSMLEILQDSYFTVGTIYLPEPAYLTNGMKKNPSYVGKFYNNVCRYSLSSQEQKCQSCIFGQGRQLLLRKRQTGSALGGTVSAELG